jgi:hypothetical protein
MATKTKKLSKGRPAKTKSKKPAKQKAAKKVDKPPYGVSIGSV